MLKFIKSAYLYVWFIVVVALLMMCLMWSVYLVDVGKIRSSLLNSPDIFHYFTDYLIFHEAIFWGQDALQDALLVPRAEFVEDRVESLYISLHRIGANGAKIFFYPRFWHGYLLFWKPVLSFLEIKEACMIYKLFQIGMLCFILYLLYRRLGFKHCVAFLTALYFISPVQLWGWLHFDMVNVMLIATLWVLLNKDSDDNYIFFVVGSATILFDFLTYPLITLGIPLIVYVCLYERGFKDDVKCVIKNSFLWLCGYAGMWFSKWVLATLLTDENVLKDGWERVLHRTYDATENGRVLPDATILHSILANVEVIWNKYTLYVLGAVLILVLISYVCSSYILKVQYKFRVNSKALVLLGVSLMPFVWYSVLVQHSIVHFWVFSHRLLAITIYSVLSAIVCCLEPIKVSKK